MKLIIEVTPHNREKLKKHHIIENFPITIGRGFNSDIIISDPYIDSSHIKIFYNKSVPYIEDLNSLNGVYINRLKKSGKINSQDIITIGNTDIRIYREDSPIKATLKMKDTHPIFSWIAKPLNAWLSALTSIILIQIWSFLEIWTNERAMVVISTLTASLAIIIIWSVLWSAASRLIINKNNFMKHVAIISIYVIGTIILWYIESYIYFIINKTWISNIINYSFNFSILSLLIYGSLNFSSIMKDNKRIIISAFFSIGVLSGIFLLSLFGRPSFNPEPPYSANIEPFLSSLVPTDSMNELMTKNKNIFNSNEFKN